MFFVDEGLFSKAGVAIRQQLRSVIERAAPSVRVKTSRNPAGRDRAVHPNRFWKVNTDGDQTGSAPLNGRHQEP
jgi:hypothetical protein